MAVSTVIPNSPLFPGGLLFKIQKQEKMSDLKQKVMLEQLQAHSIEFEKGRKDLFISHLKNTSGAESIISYVEQKGIPSYLFCNEELANSIKASNMLHNYLIVAGTNIVDSKSLVFYWPNCNSFLIQKLK